MVPPCIGIDPDTHDTAWAILDPILGLQAVGIAHVPTKIEGKSVKGEWAVARMTKAMKASFGHGKHLSWWGVVCVEGQEYYQTGGGTPDNLITLAQVAGAAAQVGADTFRSQAGSPTILIPKPKVWKGQVPKQIHQARILKVEGVEFEKVGKDPKTGYTRPTKKVVEGAWANVAGIQDIRPAQWKHLTDAIGLARWGLENYEAELKRRA